MGPQLGFRRVWRTGRVGPQARETEELPGRDLTVKEGDGIAASLCVAVQAGQ